MVIAKLLKSVHIMKNKAYIRAMTQGVAAGIEHEQLMRGLLCNSVVDIGANRGQFSLVARRCFPEAQIFALEPLKDPANRYRRVFADDARVKLFHAAIGPKACVATMHVSGRNDSSSLLPITERQDQIFPGTKEVNTATVNVGPLEDFITAENVESPALMKLDVQGFELSALKGCESLLPCFTWLYVECSFIELYAGQALADEVVAWLREHEFALCGVYNVAYDDDGSAIQADFLFGKRTDTKMRN